MTLQPDAIDLEGLPRTIGGGLKREPVEELLKRVQWEYSQLYYEHKRLKEALAKRETEPREEPKTARPALDPGTRARPEAAEVGQRGRGGRRARTGAGAQHCCEGVKRVGISTTLRGSCLLRPGKRPTTFGESARRECELMFKNVRARIELLENEFERTKALRVSELAELDATLLDVRAQMKTMLEVLSPPGSERATANGAAGREDTGATNELFPVDAQGADRSQTGTPSGVTAVPNAPDRTGLEAAS